MQYADDTILVGEARWANLWALKAISRSFKLELGLKVNSNNSNCLVSINVDNIFDQKKNVDNILMQAASFLFCNIGIFHFKFLEFSINGATSRKFTTQTPIN